MDARDLFLAQHSLVHSVAVGNNPLSSADRVLTGLSDEQMRVRPREDLNSLAWILWHIARSEDIFVNLLVAERPQVFDDAWAGRLGATRRDLGTGMTSAEVSELTRQIDLAVLRDYRDSVGRRTREVVGALRPRDWDGEVTAAAVARAAAEGAFGGARELFLKILPGRPRVMMLSGIALLHPAGHLGEAGTVRTAGGFGTGV